MSGERRHLNILIETDLCYTGVENCSTDRIPKKKSKESVKKKIRKRRKNEQEVSKGYEQIFRNAQSYNSSARLEGVTIQPMIEYTDLELILEAKKDRDFGPVILFGMGGVLTEVLKERKIQKVTASVLAENTQMLALGRKIGFKIEKEPGVPKYELSIDLKKN
ncbi:MAG: acetate--CoA ligase family protein [Deltaproteobacteria bacterium]|nr:acetate--CoA ligase family protein [Deltaproteobacteria bacterium]